MGLPMQASGRAMGMWLERQAVVNAVKLQKMQSGLDENNAYLQAHYLVYSGQSCPGCGAHHVMGVACAYCGRDNPMRDVIL